MGTSVQTPSAVKIIRSNFVLTVITIMVLLAAIPCLLIINGTFGAIRSEDLLYISGGLFASALTVLIIAMKVNFFKSTFQKAEEIKGSITNIEFHRFNVHVEYEYTYRNEKHLEYDNVFKSEKTKHCQKGDAVILLVNPDKPNKAIIRDAYA